MRYWRVQTPFGGVVVSTNAVFAVPLGIGCAGKALTVDIVKSSIADTCSIYVDLVAATLDWSIHKT
jgi:hypothetical protein